MSMKNRVLLHRCGRGQHGNLGEGVRPSYTPTSEEIALQEADRSRHRALNEQFLAAYQVTGLERFGSLSKKAAWGDYTPRASRHFRPSTPMPANAPRTKSSFAISC